MAHSDSRLHSGHLVPSGWERLHPPLRAENRGGGEGKGEKIHKDKEISKKDKGKEEQDGKKENVSWEMR